MIVFIDTGILGLLANPNKQGEAADCEQWLLGLLSKGVSVLTSDICDYEVRRSLILKSLRKSNINSIASLDELKDLMAFLPISNEAMIKAASLWAEARVEGIPTADDKSLDADMIICAQFFLQDLTLVVWELVLAFVLFALLYLDNGNFIYAIDH